MSHLLPNKNPIPILFQREFLRIFISNSHSNFKPIYILQYSCKS